MKKTMNRLVPLVVVVALCSGCASTDPSWLKDETARYYLSIDSPPEIDPERFEEISKSLESEEFWYSHETE